MGDLRWSGNLVGRSAIAVVGVGGSGIWPTIQDWGHPWLVTVHGAAGLYFALVACRDGRLTTSGDQVTVAKALRTERVQAQEIAGIVRSTEMPWTLMIWTLDGRAVRTPSFGSPPHAKIAIASRLAELEAWWIEHRGADWSLDALVQA